MSAHTWGLIIIAAYVLLTYLGSLQRPRKCSEHATDEERVKDAIKAPFVTLISAGIFVALIWAVNTVFPQ